MPIGKEFVNRSGHKHWNNLRDNNLAYHQTTFGGGLTQSGLRAGCILWVGQQHIE